MSHTNRPSGKPKRVTQPTAKRIKPTKTAGSTTASEYTPMSQREDELIDQRHTEVLDAIKGVHDRLDTLNGRTRTLEVKVGVLSWAYGLGAGAMGFLYYMVTGKSPQ